MHSRILNPKNLSIELGPAHDSYHAEFIFDNDGTDVSPLCVLKGTLGLFLPHVINAFILYYAHDMSHNIWLMSHGHIIWVIHVYYITQISKNNHGWCRPWVKTMKRIWWLWKYGEPCQIGTKPIRMWLLRIFRRWAWSNISSTNQRYKSTKMNFLND